MTDQNTYTTDTGNIVQVLPNEPVVQPIPAAPQASVKMSIASAVVVNPGSGGSGDATKEWVLAQGYINEDQGKELFVEKDEFMSNMDIEEMMAR